ncbi:MAG: D-glycero-beta-D-manno-heptose 1-phosphate adenylyltransferase [Candidatus Omnitrophota bacterium]|nr:MAG: D-glycero-beta-D-manno-heptose 1-phosphate adenylyltransferase [Candidatus Omnitrophota bacterium]RKY46113.1 MAG: D-glycero-beta-D-manno-heptose 1-phosphate adenylyltransferase [Candidatus Omnitrophota bacterium]HDN86181.1 D-glycero-beta-D-manno-heptose 1-phosphate adenylyltransferase [Candidatus Omnitrophota bacterium]
MAKVKKLNELKKILDKLKKEGKKIVFTNGCFDLIHPGHIKVLKEAKRKGDILVVGLNSDKSVRKIKGPQRPILDEKTRARVVSALEDVDFVVIFNQPTPLNLIKTIKPHCLVKGSDWKKKDIVGRDLVKKVFTVKILKGYSTTEIVNKIKRSGN